MTAPTKWKYEVLELNEQKTGTHPNAFDKIPWNDVATVKATLNRLGLEGWELVNVMPKADREGCTRTVVLFLKRVEP